MAEKSLGDFQFRTIIESGEIFYYDPKSGIWRPHGETLIRTCLRRDFPDVRGGEESEVIRYIEDVTFTRSENFQQSKSWIATQKGEIFLHNWEYTDCIDPEHYMKSKFNVFFRPRERCPRFMKFMQQILPDEKDRITVLESLASVFVPTLNLEKAFMFVGTGANGKSTLLKVYTELFERDSVCSISLQNLIYSRFAAAELEGKIVNIYNDIDTKSIKDLGRFKMIVSNELLSVERKGRDFKNIIPLTKHIFASNQPPKIDEDTDAVFRRFIIINFPQKFEGDKETKLVDELVEEKEGVFNLLLQVARCLKNRGNFLYEPSIKEIRLKWRDESDPVFQFLNNSGIIIKDPNSEITKSSLYSLYARFCQDKKYIVKSQIEFTKEMKRLGYEENRTAKDRFWRGLRLDTGKEAQEKL